MLKTPLIHPEIISTLSLAGHGSQVLLADGNFPYNSYANLEAPRIFLNLTAGLLTITQVLEVLAQVLPIEALQVIQPLGTGEPSLWSDIHQIVPGLTLERVEKKTFEEATGEQSVVLVIATGDQRLHSSVLLTIGALTVTETALETTVDAVVEIVPEALMISSEKQEKTEKFEKPARSKKTTKAEDDQPAPEIIEAPEIREGEILEVITPEEISEVLRDPFAEDATDTKPEVKPEIKSEAPKKEEAPNVGNLFE